MLGSSSPAVLLRGVIVPMLYSCSNFNFAGADLDAFDGDCVTAIQAAKDYGHKDIARYFGSKFLFWCMFIRSLSLISSSLSPFSHTADTSI